MVNASIGYMRSFSRALCSHAQIQFIKATFKLVILGHLFYLHRPTAKNSIVLVCGRQATVDGMKFSRILRRPKKKNVHGHFSHSHTLEANWPTKWKPFITIKRISMRHQPNMCPCNVLLINFADTRPRICRLVARSLSIWIATYSDLADTYHRSENSVCR